MAQYHELNNHYQIDNIRAWPDRFKSLQESSGQPVVDIAHEYSYDVGGQGKPEHIYDIRIQGTDIDGVQTRWLVVNLGGKELINDPMSNLRSAEELVDTMMAIRNYNVGRRPEAMAEDTPDKRYLVNEAVQRFAYEMEMKAGGFDNFYQQYDPLTWLETAAKLKQEHGMDVETGVAILFRTGPAHIDTGIYKIQKVERENAVGLEVSLDGAPLFNYPKPLLKTAEQIVSYILQLQQRFGSLKVGDEFNYNSDNPKPLVASMKDGQTEVKLFVNGTITITGPGLVNMVTMSAEDSDRANELMEKILDLTPKQ
jgi:hypothetical protein